MATKNEVLTVSKGFLIASDLLLKGRKNEAVKIFAKLASTSSRRRGMVDVIKAFADATEQMVNDDEDIRDDSDFEDVNDDNDFDDVSEDDEVDNDDDMDETSEVVTASVRRALRAIKKKTVISASRGRNRRFGMRAQLKNFLTTSSGREWVEAFDQADLATIGKALQINFDIYESKLKSGKVRIFGLSDSSMKFHVAAEYLVSENEMGEVRGKMNKPPIGKYQSDCDELEEALCN